MRNQLLLDRPLGWPLSGLTLLSTMRNQLLLDRPLGWPLSGLTLLPTMRNQLLLDRPLGWPLSGLSFISSYRSSGSKALVLEKRFERGTRHVWQSSSKVRVSHSGPDCSQGHRGKARPPLVERRE
jgi:hypothetical protein